MAIPGYGALTGRRVPTIIAHKAFAGKETDMEKAQALAEKITSKAEDALSGIDQEIMKWPAEFRAIMWGAVVEVASLRRSEAQSLADGQAEQNVSGDVK